MPVSVANLTNAKLFERFDKEEGLIWALVRDMLNRLGLFSTCRNVSRFELARVRYVSAFFT